MKVGRENCLVAIVGGGLTVEGVDSLGVLGGNKSGNIMSMVTRPQSQYFTHVC